MAQTGGKGSGGRSPMTQSAASRIQSSTARANGGVVPAGSFAARAQSAAAGNSTANGGGNSGGSSK